MTTNTKPDLIKTLQGLSDRAYCDYITKMRSDACLGWEAKVQTQRFGKAEIEAHTKAGELLGRHKAFSEAAAKAALAAAAQPPAGFVLVPTELAERVQETMVNDVKQYPPLPASFGHVHSDGNYCQDMEPSHESWPIDIYTAVQMRAYVDADRAMRAARDAEDAAHIKNLCELVRMPNAEYVADAHNAAVKYLRLRARAKQ